MKISARLARSIFLAILFLNFDARAATKDFHGQNLKNKDLKNEAFDNANLSSANLESADLTNATMKNANLRDADLQSARLTTADLTGADLRGANLKQATLQDAKFSKANLTGDELYFAYGFKRDEEATRRIARALDNAGADISIMAERNGHIVFKEANLSAAKLHGQLDDVDFRRADLRGANLTDTSNADKARWKGALYDSNTHWPASFDYAAAGAVVGSASAPATTTNAAAVPAFNPVGNWMIKVESNGAREEGLLTIASDQTFKWDYSVKSQPVSGNWKNAPTGPGAIVLSRGEAGADWIMKTQTGHPDRPDSAELVKTSGGEKRWAVPVAAPRP